MDTLMGRGRLQAFPVDRGQGRRPRPKTGGTRGTTTANDTGAIEASAAAETTDALGWRSDRRHRGR